MIGDFKGLVAAYDDNLQHVLKQIQSAIASLTDTLHLSKEHTEKDQTALMLRLNMLAADDAATVRVSTVVALVYLSFTSVAVCESFC